MKQDKLAKMRQKQVFQEKTLQANMEKMSFGQRKNK